MKPFSRRVSDQALIIRWPMLGSGAHDGTRPRSISLASFHRGATSGFVDRASALGDAAFGRDALPLQKTKPGDGYRMRRAQNRRSQFPQRYCLIDTNRNNLSSKSWRRDRLIRLLLQFGHVITRKRLYSLIKWVQNPILVYHLSHSRRRALSKSVLDRLFADKKADLSVSGYIQQ